MKKELLSKLYSECRLCPRKCGADRFSSVGRCRSGSVPAVADYLPHRWEEPCISGSCGAGAVFFSGCPLGCVYCQNVGFSRSCTGKLCSADELAGLFLSLQKQGVHNLDLVSPTHFTPTILEALDICAGKLKIPVIWNTSGYELPETLDLLSGYVDIFLTDFKYIIPERAHRYSAASDYGDIASAALERMLSLAGKVCFASDGLMKSGVIVRHLVLPGGLDDTRAVLDRISDILTPYGRDYALISLMSQYTNNGMTSGFPELERRVTSLEYRRACEYLESLGLTGYEQDISSSANGYVPGKSNS